MEEQVRIEMTMRDEGIIRYEKNHDRKPLEDTSAGRNLIRAEMAAVAAGIAELHQLKGTAMRRAIAARKLREIDANRAAYVALRVMFHMVSMNRVSLQNTALAVGRAIEDELRIDKFERENEGAYKWQEAQLKARGMNEAHSRKSMVFRMTQKGVEWDDWGTNDKVNVGMKLIEIVTSTTDLFSYSTPASANEGGPGMANKARRGKKYERQIEISEAGNQKLAQIVDYGKTLRPVLLPTVVPPKPWAALDRGGYYTPYVPKQRLVKGRMVDWKRLKTADLSLVYRALNAVQETPWQIDTEVLEVLEHLWTTASDWGVIPKRDPIPELPPFDGDTESDAFKAWKIQQRTIKDKNVASRSKRMAFLRTIETAREFAKYERIYFPHNLDWRGRIYAIPGLLNPQGTGFVKACLKFAEGKHITDNVALGWLFIHGANVWGEDKVSLEDRIKWVEDNFDMVRRVAANPYDNREWTEADDPFPFLQWCFDVVGVVDLGKPSYLAVAMDGSCNGIQHFSAMLRDEVGGRSVNLLPSDKPNDIYADVAKRTLEILMEGDPDPKRNLWAETWAAAGIMDRKITKRQVMVLPYGGTTSSCLEYTLDAVQEKLGDDRSLFGDDHYKACCFLSSVIWRAMGDVIVGAQTIRNYMQKLTWRASKYSNKGITWTAPSGFPVTQEYRSLDYRRVKTQFHGQVVKFRDYYLMDEIDQHRQKNSVAPNFVHSMDAAALVLTVDHAIDHGMSAFAMIHDSYGVHAADAETFAKLIRLEFITMYEDYDVLTDWADRLFLEHLPAEEQKEDLPTRPRNGKLDLQEVLNADYFFA
ncbi:unnamed protein product [Effrenium voratum]|uniref:DNA-directed RNA polymerase n=1 Tax=Effrenium voratum TaxID=2562239 RepID=A0AA36MJ03_9DINO|nr:unnamed protein product [Effrenium voratum]